MKRFLDILLSAIGLIVAAPLFGLIALLLYLDSPGNVIFSQTRLGKNGKYFKIHKFRKFPVDWGTKGPGVTLSGDVRMTPIGAILERTKADELPQLWNILKGEMSFVGPRPESTRYEELFTEKYKRVLDFKPGIFGPNQIAFRNESSMYPKNQDPEEFYRTTLFPQKALTDIKYFERANSIKDIWLMVKGIWITVAGTVNWKKFYQQHALILSIDLIILEVSWFCANFFRFGMPIEGKQALAYETGCWLFPIIVLPLMYLAGCYRNPLRYFSSIDAVRMIASVPVIWIIASFIELYFYHRYFSFSVSLLSLLLFICFLVSARVWRREIWLRSHEEAQQSEDSRRHVLIYGGNKKGSALARFFEQSYKNVHVIGFIDDDENLKGRYLNGRKVLGNWKDIDLIHTKSAITEIWVCEALPSNVNQAAINWTNRNNIRYFLLDHQMVDLYPTRQANSERIH